MTDTTTEAYKHATNANRLAWSLASNSGDAKQIGKILTDYIDRTNEVQLLPELISALLLITTLALEPALTVADKAGVNLRAEFTKALHNVTGMQAKKLIQSLHESAAKRKADDDNPAA